MPPELQKIIQDYIRPNKCRICKKATNQLYCKLCSKAKCYICNKQLEQLQPLICYKCAFYND